ncbi:MAG: YidC/Oxa1 family membrane protein insertase, partial [Maricaulis maris]
MGEDQRNLFIALGLILVILTGYQMFVMGPAEEERRAEQAAVEASQ